MAAIPNRPLITDENQARILARNIIADFANYEGDKVTEAIANGNRDITARIFEEDRTENFNLRVIPEFVNSGIWDEALDYLIARWEKDYRELGRIRGSQ